MHSKPKWPWHLLTAVLLLSFTTLLYHSAIKFDYKWNWDKIPKFVLAKVNTTVHSTVFSRVEKIEVNGKQAVVTLKKEDSSTYQVTVDNDSLRVSESDSLNDGDTVGHVSQWKVGPLLIGLWCTLWLSFISGVIGSVIGVVVGLCRISKNPTLATLSSIYVEIIRGTPLLVQLFVFYFFIGSLLKLEKELAGLITLSLFAGAYIAEIIRSGIQSLDKGQMEAARSLGFTHYQAMRYIIMPQAFKRVIPPLVGQLTSLVKDSSLVSVISIVDLTKAAREVASSSFYTFEVWFTVAFIYLVINFLLSKGALMIERKLSNHD